MQFRDKSIYRVSLALMVITMLLAVSGEGAAQAQDTAPQQGQPVIYLPLLARSGNAADAPAPTTPTTTTPVPTTPVPTTPTTTTPVPTPPTTTTTPEPTTPVPTTPTTTTPVPTTPVPQVVTGGFYMQPDKKTNSSNVVIDAQGGVHVAHSYAVPSTEHPAAAYWYCPGPIDACSKDSNLWKGVNLADTVYEVQLRLTADGRPRMLIQTSSEVYNGGNDFYYAECNQACTEPQSWVLTRVATRYDNSISAIVSSSLPRRSFALDPQGRPRFVLSDANYVAEPDHYGVFYYTCDSNCTNAANWNEALISLKIDEPFRKKNESMSFPALAFTRDGRPRLVGQFFPMEGGLDAHGLFYFECDNGCDTSAGWNRVKLEEMGGLTYKIWDLELDSADRPRIAYFKGGTLDNTGSQLYYLQCDANCLTLSNWRSLNLGLGSDVGRGADLELDTQDRPRIVSMRGSSTVIYSWCNTGCDVASNWQHQEIDGATTLDQTYPVARPFTCDAGIWELKAPMFVLDKDDNPRLAYDAAYQARCLTENPDRTKPDFYDYRQIWHTVRVRYLPQP